MGELRTRATLDNRRFKAGVDGMERSVNGLSKNIGRLKGIIGTAFAVGGITAFARSVADLGSEISDMVTQTGVGARSLQGLLHATRLAGAEQQKMVMALSQVRDAMGAVLSGGEGSQQLQKAFSELGLSMSDLASMNTDQVLERMAVGFVKADRSAQSFSALVDLIGRRNAPQLIEVLNKLASDGLDGVAKSAEAAGQVMDEKFLQKLDEMSDKMNEIGRRVKIGSLTVGDALAGGFETAAKRITLAFQSIGTGIDPLTFIEQVEAAEKESKANIEAAEAAQERRKAEVAASQAIRDEVEREAVAREAAFESFSEQYRKLFDLTSQGSDPAQIIKNAQRSTSTADQLTRIGGFASSGGGRSELQRMIQEQQRIRSHVAAIQRDIERQKHVTIAEP